MIKLRHKMAKNAGFKNYRDFKHHDLHRFDYTVDDVLTFHESIEKHVLPLVKKISEVQMKSLGLNKGEFYPWDVHGKPENETALKPFENGKELLEKTVSIFSKIKPEFGENLKKMNENDLFDLDARKGKAPGGYNYGLEVTGMPFIFMNAAGTHTDVVTLMHEGGHAMHTFLTNSEPLFQYRNCPSEMAETASMSMELISSGYWSEFYNEEDHKRARREHLERIVGVFPWVAIIDSFQHWVYTNPEHTTEQRDEHFASLMNRFGSGLVNWDNHYDYLKNTWQKQLHVFSVPFYYIEYAIAQIGALQVYKNFVQDNEKGIQSYIDGLKIGSSKPIPEIWDSMNIKFDFSADTIKELMEFVEKEWEKYS